MINYIPPQYPRHIPSLQPKMPQLIQSLMLNYMQQKYATGRQKEEQEFQMEEGRKNRDYQKEQLKVKADLGKYQYLADMHKTHIKLSGPDKVPKGYEVSDITPGLDGTYWVKRKEKPIKIGEKVTTEVGGRKITQFVAGYNEEGMPHDFQGKPLAYGSSSVRQKGTIRSYQKDKQQLTEEWDGYEWKEIGSGAKFKEGESPSIIKQYDMAVKQGYRGSITKWKKEMAKAGASTMTQIMGEAREKRAQEIHGIKVGATVGEKRAALTTGKQDKAVYGAEGSQFNNMNKQNEVAYWDTSKWDNKTNIMKLSKEAIDDGWTPAEVQRQATISGMTVEQVLKQIDELPK